MPQEGSLPTEKIKYFCPHKEITTLNIKMLQYYNIKIQILETMSLEVRIYALKFL